MRPLIIGHRGASAYEPENSLAAFRRAAELGADAVELDVHSTNDGSIVVIHDPDLDGAPIRQLGLEEVKAHLLSNGEPVPTLDEALQVLLPGMLAFIEVKTLEPGQEKTLLRVLDRSPHPADYHVHSFDHRIVRRLRRLRPSLVCGVLSSSYPVEPVEQVTQALATELWQEESLLDAELVSQAHERGVAVYAWTVDRPERIRSLIGIGVDGICTNAPDVARGAME